MNIPDDLRYTKEHEWVSLDGNIVTIGITEYAQAQLGDIVYVEFPKEGELVTKDETFGVLESVKAVSDCYSPVTGKISEVNEPLADTPETVNEDCYGEGWLIKVELGINGEMDPFMDAQAYKTFVEEESA
jgi:glycine cleavage system H protein